MKNLWKTFLMMLLAGLVCLSFVSCEDDSDDEVAETVTYDAPDLATTADKTIENAFSDLTGKTTNDNVVHNDGTTHTGYCLNQFVSKSEINELVGLDADATEDARDLFAVNITAGDGYAFRTKSEFDLSWGQFKEGYYLSAHDEVPVTFPSEEISKKFDIKGANKIELFRKLDIKKTDGTTVIVEVRAFAGETINYRNWKDNEDNQDTGFKLSEVIYDYITTEKSSFNYKISTIDSFIPEEGSEDYLADNTANWETLQNAYLLFPAEEGDEYKIIFLNEDDNTTDTTYPTQKYKNLKYPQTIELISTN